ncbi:MAG: pantetheine-phosphate adenylyltransferase [Prevotellaceae bacterium]|jgi:pantetheine-phosphate adenylyltransferase|nr:pantetheine-phosphate adenylyltransferase [Prevotellaceae bacterium]
MKTAIFPGTFDPFTIGHFDVVQRALQIFDKVIIATIGDNQKKKTLFPAETRADMIKQALQPYTGNVEVVVYDTMTVDFCRAHHSNFIIRGIRTIGDYNFESIMAQANQKLSPVIDTVFFPSRPEHAYICSSVVRDILLYHGDVSAFIPKGMKIAAISGTKE